MFLFFNSLYIIFKFIIIYMNQNKISTIINHFRLNHNFFQPYQIILDGNFIKLLVQRNQPFQKKIQTLLNGKVFTKVTECILRQLEVLGQKFQYVLAQAKKQQLIKCKHIMGVTPKNCIQQLIGQKNIKKFMICTQDIQLRRVIRQLPNVPIFYFGPDQRITMEDIQKKHLKVLQQHFKQKLLPKEHQIKIIQKYKQKEKQKQKQLKKKQLLKQASFQGIQLKKFAKGPNPLSIKKKKRTFDRKQTIQQNKNIDQQQQQQEVEQNQNENQKLKNQQMMPAKKKRIRKRKNKNNSKNFEQRLRPQNEQ